MGTSVADSKPGGGGKEGVRQLLQGDGAGGAAARGGDVGTYPEDISGPGELPARGHATDHRKTTTEKGGWAMDIPSYEGGHPRGGVLRDLEDHHK